MSLTEVLDRVRDSPLRARSLLTVRAAISSARDSDAPRSRAESLTCSYWRPRLLFFLTPAGGMSLHLPVVVVALPLPGLGPAKRRCGRPRGRMHLQPKETARCRPPTPS